MSIAHAPRDRAWLVRLLRTTWRDARASFADTPAGAWGRWAGVLVLGYALSWLVVVLCVRFARARVDRGLQAWDERTLAAFAESPFSFPAGLWFEAWASSAFLVPMLLVAVVAFLRAGLLFRSASLLLAYLSTKGLVLGAWQLWNRARPEMIADGIASPGLHSFPSGHAVNATVLFGLLGVFWWRASRSAVERALLSVLVVAVILLTALGRLRLGTHWPSDIVAGLLIGLCWMTSLAVATALGERSAR